MLSGANLLSATASYLTQTWKWCHLLNSMQVSYNSCNEEGFPQFIKSNEKKSHDEWLDVMRDDLVLSWSSSVEWKFSWSLKGTWANPRHSNDLPPDTQTHTHAQSTTEWCSLPLFHSFKKSHGDRKQHKLKQNKVAAVSIIIVMVLPLKSWLYGRNITRTDGMACWTKEWGKARLYPQASLSVAVSYISTVYYFTD